jgi:hypothetical protein
MSGAGKVKRVSTLLLLAIAVSWLAGCRANADRVLVEQTIERKGAELRERLEHWRKLAELLDEREPRSGQKPEGVSLVLFPEFPPTSEAWQRFEAQADKRAVAAVSWHDLRILNPTSQRIDKKVSTRGSADGSARPIGFASRLSDLADCLSDPAHPLRGEAQRFHSCVELALRTRYVLTLLPLDPPPGLPEPDPSSGVAFGSIHVEAVLWDVEALTRIGSFSLSANHSVSTGVDYSMNKVASMTAEDVKRLDGALRQIDLAISEDLHRQLVSELAAFVDPVPLSEWPVDHDE